MKNYPMQMRIIACKWKLSHANENYPMQMKITACKWNLSNANEKLSHANEKLSNANEKVSHANEKLSNANEKDRILQRFTCHTRTSMLIFFISPKSTVLDVSKESKGKKRCVILRKVTADFAHLRTNKLITFLAGLCLCTFIFYNLFSCPKT